MNVALPLELEKRVNDRVERGDFANRDEFFKKAAELLLDVCDNAGQPIPVDGSWENRLGAILEEAQISGEAQEMNDQDWEDVERQARALMLARKKA